ncbi:alpha/beta fold hydrolase [Streptomyces sp. DSM 44917]|uniref:Alpha/beta fold hydrolase n=1 Tax=Streptomyces boetiae TaxID=3075541 RepID=A0ABU2LDN1_9ACTN|nr:alpha/beta fold hydrolase [Streptomyces sp. DSM 44917]MDT0309612.1 alpha/beta fold hydrolase [Streptomyces sp. DSM 44917]
MSPTRTPEPALRTGAGEPLLLLHPFMLSHHVWTDVAAELSDSYRIFAPTLPAHWGGPRMRARDVSIKGLADAVERMLDAEGWSTCHIAGNSLGGWISLELARRGRARTVTAIAPGGGWRQWSLTELRTGALFLALYPSSRIFAAAALRNEFVRRQFLGSVSRAPRKVSVENAHHMIRASSHCSGHLPFIASALRHGGIRGLDEITCPTQVVFCASDRVLPPRSHSRVFRDGLPEARFTTLPKAGHVPMLEAPDLVAGTIRDFLAETAAGSGPAVPAQEGPPAVALDG